MRKPRLLDFGCKAGGCSVGYHRAGFDVVGVDIEPQPNYPFEFHQADATTFPLDGFDVYSSSMPCHDHSSLRSLSGLNGTGWLLAALRDRVHATGKPYVIENVAGAPMRPDLKLCGCMFPELRLERVRWFELGNWPWMILAPEHPRSRCRAIPTVTKGRRAAWDAGLKVSITGDVGTYLGPEAMGIDWMTGDELSQAIPPAYTEYIGRQLVAHLEVAA